MSYNTAISACDKLRDADAAVRLLRQARENNIVPDVVSYNTVISALGHNSLWQVRDITRPAWHGMGWDGIHASII